MRPRPPRPGSSCRPCLARRSAPRATRSVPSGTTRRAISSSASTARSTTRCRTSRTTKRTSSTPAKSSRKKTSPTTNLRNASKRPAKNGKVKTGPAGKAARRSTSSTGIVAAARVRRRYPICRVSSPSWKPAATRSMPATTPMSAASTSMTAPVPATTPM